MLDDDDDDTKQNLPAPNSYNNWDAEGGSVGERLKCVDGVWTFADGTEVPAGTQLLALGTITCLERWCDDGKTLRPHFEIVGWRRLGAIEGSTLPRELPPANAYAEAKQRKLTVVDPVSNRITEVERPSLKEELNDDLPF